MKVYVIMQKATEYNDEFDSVQEEGAKIYKAYRNKPTKEQVDAAKWDAIQNKTPDYDGGWPDDIAYVEEIEVNEDQIVQPEEVVAAPSKKGTYAEKQLKVAQLRIEAANLAKEHFDEKSKELFEKYPDLIDFSWTQYTPYFNDGDECTFRVNTDYPKVNLKGFEDDDGEEGHGKILYFRDGASDKVYIVDNNWNEKKVFFSYGRRGASLVTGCKIESEDYNARKDVEEAVIAEKKREGYGSPVDDVKELLASMGEEDMRSIFGDHMEITVTRDGANAEEYSHD